MSERLVLSVKEGGGGTHDLLTLLTVVVAKTAGIYWKTAEDREKVLAAVFAEARRHVSG